MRTINWNLIRTLPADAAIVTGGPEYGCFRCAHVPAGRHHVEALFAEIGSGLYRKLLAKAFWLSPRAKRQIERDRIATAHKAAVTRALSGS